MSFPKIGLVRIHKLFAKSEDAWLNIRAWSERFPEDVLMVRWKVPPPASCENLPRVLNKGEDVCQDITLERLSGVDVKAIADMVDPKDCIWVDTSGYLQGIISRPPELFVHALPLAPRELP